MANISGLRTRLCGLSRLNIINARSYRLNKNVFGNSAVSLGTETSSDVQYNSPTAKDSEKQISNLINAYRRFGYLAADLDPLKLWQTRNVIELTPSLYGFDERNLAEKMAESSSASGYEFIEHLRRVYCGEIAVEFMHLLSMTERQWFAETYESCIAEAERALTDEQRIDALKAMLKGKAWENFLSKKFPTLKRYSCEGSEVTLALYQYMLEECANYGIKEFVFDGAHRGRMAIQTGIFRFPVEQLFRKIRGKPEFPDDVQGSGDVLTHQESHFDYVPKAAEEYASRSVHVSTVPNPSHLEVSLAVSMGKCRARARTLLLGDYGKPGSGGHMGDGILCVHHHGDGGFTGQGVVWESLLLSGVPHFRIGGGIHVVVNNQVAFTAERHIGRSTLHCTDVAKALDAPVIHVNGASIENVLMAAKLALLYRDRFRKEVFIHLVCYRRHGHNELDDPSITQPLMYQHVREQASAVDEYSLELERRGVLPSEHANDYYRQCTDELDTALTAVDAEKVPASVDHLQGHWTGFQQAPPAVTHWDTGLPLDLLRFVGAKSVEVPLDFKVHVNLKKNHVAARLTRLEAYPSASVIDWSTAEAMAFGSLLLQGYDVRISGQDVGRATFSHRHVMLVDQTDDSVYIPLNAMTAEIAEKEQNPRPAFLEVANSPLSEAAIIGFEYGFAMENPRRLVVWEAQFGDFYNAAQVQIDTLLSTGEAKWLRQNGLVLLLPHGIDGAGPDHSSAHVERFLQLTDSREAGSLIDGDNVNMYVVNPTSSAQYFHLLRRQMLMSHRKPLVVISPKVLLRHPAAASPLADFAPGTHFRPVVYNRLAVGERLTTVLFTSGKHAVMLEAEIAKRQLSDAFIVVRLEALCPFPAPELSEVVKLIGETVAKKTAGKLRWVWSQEEARNAGVWSFVRPRFRHWLGIELEYNGRPELSWMATSIGQHHAREAETILTDLFKE